MQEPERRVASARAMAAVMAWIEGWPPPREVFGDAARWLPAAVFLGGTAAVLLLLFGAPLGAEAGRWLVGAAAVPLWILRVATLEDERLRAARFGAALPMVSWWLGGVAVVAGMWAPGGPVGAGLTAAAALLLLFLAHGRYAVAERG